MNLNRQIPVQKGKTYTIDVVRLGTSGEGVGKYNGFTVFIPGALPGEAVEARITLVKKQYHRFAGPDTADMSCICCLRRLSAAAHQL